MVQRSNEHLVALPDGGAVIRVRTVKRRTMDERWNAEAMEKSGITEETKSEGWQPRRE